MQKLLAKWCQFYDWKYGFLGAASRSCEAILSQSPFLLRFFIQIRFQAKLRLNSDILQAEITNNTSESNVIILFSLKNHFEQRLIYLVH